MSTVTLKNVYKIYENKEAKGDMKPAVSDFSMHIEDKEFIVFVGPSGCGKSTTLRMIAGLEKITKGQIYIDDTLVNDVAPKDRDIAMVFQNYALYPHMSVYENMAFGLRLRKIPDIKRDKKGNPVLDKEGKEIPVMRKLTEAEIKEKVMEAAKILAIEEYLQRKPKALSGGQRQRVALGRTIVRKPKVFLLDEPLSNLDAKLRATMRSEIIKLHEKLEATFIYVTHDQVEAMTMGTRIVVMKDGFVQQIGAPKELYSRPVNTFVAGFIGTPQINFFNGRLTPDGKLKFANDQEITLSKATMDKFDAEKIGSGIDVIMGIRPGDLKLVDNGDKATTVVAKVEVVEALGNETIVYSNLDLNGEQSLERTATSITLSAKLKSDPERHSKIFLDIDEDYIHLFDKETEVSIRK
ncbi:MAG: ATP-binding cassette domain-containing protein [Clostridia bacterium]|nr:ATP-binding cassette domain-containing protein [Clostridia bacterium]MBQ4586675.1 ATP-binding cassette domain-containing protein [Clostridia bacterium]